MLVNELKCVNCGFFWQENDENHPYCHEERDPYPSDTCISSDDEESNASYCSQCYKVLCNFFHVGLISLENRIKATPHKARLAAWRHIYLQIFRHLAQKFFAGRQPAASFLYNLTAYQHHQLCAVLP